MISAQGLLPFVSAASRKAHVSEWSGCSVAIDAYGWLHRGAFACADRLARGDSTDLHIKYCMKYVNMLLSRNIKPILVFDGRHLPAKAATEAKRRESRDIAKKRAAELLRLGQMEEARAYMRRSVDITHEMALQLIRACRACGVDCIVAPYEADAQLAFLNIRNIVQLVITEDSDLILFGCTKILFKMDLDGSGVLVESSRLPLVMKCPIERYTFERFRQMCVMSGCDYLASLPGIGLAKARQFVTSTQDPNFVNALKKLPSFFNKSQLVVTDEYRESFLKAEATFKHQYVFDPLTRSMTRLLDPHDEGTELELCCNAGEQLEAGVAFQLALGNLDPFTLRNMDDWHPDRPQKSDDKRQSQGWNEGSVCKHPSIWDPTFVRYIKEEYPWRKKSVKREDPILQMLTRPRRKVLVVPETQDDSLTIDSLKSMYCVEPDNKRQKMEEEFKPERTSPPEPNITRNSNNEPTSSQEKTSPILVNKNRSFKRAMAKSSYSILKRLSKFPRTLLDDKVVESKFFTIESKETHVEINSSETVVREDDIEMEMLNSQKENSPNKEDKKSPKMEDKKAPKIEDKKAPKFEDKNSPKIEDKKAPKIEDKKAPKIEDKKSPMIEDKKAPKIEDKKSPTKENKKSPILETKVCRNPFRVKTEKELVKPLEEITFSEDIVIENTYPMETLLTPVDTQSSYGESPKISLEEFKCSATGARGSFSQPTSGVTSHAPRRLSCKPPGLTKRSSASTLPANQPTLLSKFGFQRKAVLKR